MKLIVAVVENPQVDGAVEVLLEAGIRVTRLASTGGLLRQGNTTLMMGVEDAEVGHVMSLLGQRVPGSLAIVLPLERYERF